MIYTCKRCGYSFSVERARCPKCGNSDFSSVEKREGKVVQYWKLTATPEGVEDSYYLCLVDLGGAKVFCRSAIEPEESVVLDEKGTCRPA
ncbi:hypothetical protein [Sulfolobus acidocaldarius]|uniref:Uncharacterized protein n=4 Tax=Sulfolobus acidocaldarius TaxID=2285 RepID=Q4J851_SULAC|nr:hypothetical protein [Sulfolobus acidocaldarius]AAY81035.1 hypothetical protein Saci_1729 [Sulfolobus acidocaldarius DSM 639]AGE71641.1 hypothetical protein SacN8_08405 [Sulfolobus acidocaldarius N8]AGE73915.1 hypothetical protein SacRon12I_08420 [Sulfolobus acidocaldarius Ron12/I]ALU30144.1 hypothetical protein ATY89_09485 [Sulfolobus acidocaldarius]ALU30838.1 hypothetical protein ATZ20_00895 [Sulfolobus acidocaldarius]